MKNRIGVVSLGSFVWVNILLCVLCCHLALADQVVITPDKVKASAYHSSTATVHGPSTATHINLGKYSLTGDKNFEGNMAYCTIGGGWNNWVSRQCGTVAGGCSNDALGPSAAVVGGSGNRARGEGSTVGGGQSNQAGGDFSWAGGKSMQLTDAAKHTFVWGHAEYDNRQEISTPNAFLIFPGGTMGRVGIGTSRPVEKLHIRERANDLGAAILLDSTGGTNGRQYYVGSTLSSNIGGPGLFQIFDATAREARFNITASGNTGIGRLPSAHKLEVAGDALKTTGGNTWKTSSDERLKDITGEYTRGLDEVVSLAPVTFTYKKGNPHGLSTHEEGIGFIAQEVQAVFPEAVSQGPDGYLDFNMHPVNVALVNAIKELKAENEALRREIHEIKEALGM